jgi:hypothetical protein
MISPNSRNRQLTNRLYTGKPHYGGHWAGGIDKESAPGSGLDWKPPPQLDVFLALKDFCRKHWPDAHENVSLKFRLRIHVCFHVPNQHIESAQESRAKRVCPGFGLKAERHAGGGARLILHAQA